MCFQGFAHFLCGHDTVYTALCADASALDLPLYHPLSCPTYAVKSCSPNCPCGVGKYYCVQSRDGAFLDNMHCRQRNAVQEVAESKAKIVQMQRSAKMMVDDAVKEGKEAGEVKRSVPFKEIVHAVALEHNDEQQLELKRALLDEVAATTQKWMVTAGRTGDTMPDWLRTWIDAAVSGNIDWALAARPKVLSTLSGGPAASSRTPTRDARIVPSQSSIPFDQEQLAPRAIPPSFTGRLPPLAPPPFAVPPQFAAPALNRFNNQAREHTDDDTVLQDEDNIVVKHTGRRRRLDPLAREVEELKYDRPSIERSDTMDSTWSESKSSTNKRSQPKKTVKQESVLEGSSSVRRSARTRGKKISYAEPSDPISRTPSPQKSDDSSFSPPKSDLSERTVLDRRVSTTQPSPLKMVMSAGRPSNLSRSDNSLVEKIAEWSKRGSGISSASAQHVPAQSNDVVRTSMNAHHPPQRVSMPISKASMHSSAFATLPPMSRTNNATIVYPLDHLTRSNVQAATGMDAFPRPQPPHHISDGVPSIYPLPPGFRNLDELRTYVADPARTAVPTSTIKMNHANTPSMAAGFVQESPGSRDPFTTLPPARAPNMVDSTGGVPASTPIKTMDMATALQTLKSTPDPIKRSMPSFASSPGRTPPSSKRIRLSNFAPPETGKSTLSTTNYSGDGSQDDPNARGRTTSGRKTSRKASRNVNKQETPTREAGRGNLLQDSMRAMSHAGSCSGGVAKPSPATLPSALRRDSVWGGEAVGMDNTMTNLVATTASSEHLQGMQAPPYPGQYQVVDVVSRENPQDPFRSSMPPPFGAMQVQQSQAASQKDKNDQQFMAELEQFDKDYPQQQPADATMRSDRQWAGDMNWQVPPATAGSTAAGGFDYMADLPQADGKGWDFGEDMMGGYGHVDGA